MTRFTRALLVALSLTGCDPRTANELAELREGLAQQSQEVSALEGRIERLEAALADARVAQARAEAALSALPPTPAIPTTPAVPATPDMLDLSITCAANRCTVLRAAFLQALANPAVLVRGVRVVPNVQDGVSNGFKLFGIRADSPYALLGLQNGDVVTEIGGKPLRTVDSALEAYTALRSRDHWTIKGERHGAPLELTVELRD